MIPNGLAIVPQYQDPQMLQTIKETVCKGASEAQFRMFIEVCKATGLNPFLKEIYYAPQIGVMASRDGYLRKANDHPQFDGMETRVERDEKNIPIKAVCSVWRKDRNHPVICEAYFNEYKKASQVWQQYPSAMIAKVAEVLALKRSFAINGVVTEEEVGEQGSKEAQKEYLATKGLDPYVAPKHQNNQPPPDVRTASEQHKALILETAKMLDDPPQTDMGRNVSGVQQPGSGLAPSDSGIPLQGNAGSIPARSTNTIEMRHASQVAEADAQLKEVVKPAKKAKGFVSFDVLKHFGIVKQEMREDFGDDSAYYSIITGMYGYKHANEIRDNDQAREIYKALGNERNRLKQEKELLGTLEHASEVLGARVFGDLLGTYGAEKITDVMAMTGDALSELLKAMKECVDAKNAGGAA